MREIIRLGLMLALICGVSAAGLTAVYSTTLPLIEEQRAAKLQESLELCVPGSEVCSEIEVDGRVHWVLRDDDSIVGASTLVEADGYGTRPMEIMLGVNTQGEILNVIILSMSETVGIGTQVKSDDFLGRFIGKSIEEDALEVDAITGATISSDAVNDGVRKAAEILRSDFLTRPD